MQFQDSIKTCFNKYVDFKGRASRSEFWWWFLFSIVVSIVAMFISEYLYGAVILGLFLPGLSVFVRRLHDSNRSGWWYFLSFIPLVGAIILLVWLIGKGTTGSNEYGAEPTDVEGYQAPQMIDPGTKL